MLEALAGIERTATGGTRWPVWGESTLTTPTLTPPVASNSSASYALTGGTCTWDIVLNPDAQLSTGDRGHYSDNVDQMFGPLAAYALEIGERRGEAATVRSPAELLELLRTRVGLRVSELVDLLGVSRRSIYTWRERGALSRENELRLTGFVKALDPLLGQFRPVEIRAWLAQGEPARLELLRHGLFDLVRSDALEAAQPPAVTVQTARQVSVGHDVDQAAPTAFDYETRQAFMERFARPRSVSLRSVGTPPEITGMDGEQEE